MYMLTTTGQIFKNRKEAKKILGQAYHNKLVKEGKFIVVDPELNVIPRDDVKF